MLINKFNYRISFAAYSFLVISLVLTGSISAAVQHVTDFNGDAKTDFSVLRDQNNALVWYNFDGVSVPPAGITYNFFGLADTDTITPADFDGDNKSDIAVWRPGVGGVAGFYILQSMTNTIRFETFGVNNDDPTVVADYDGDLKADPAVYRCPATGFPAGQCFFYYRGSLNNPSGSVTAVAWGFGNDVNFVPYTGDFDGDGKTDYCIQRANPNNTLLGQFIMLRSSDQGVEYIDWGLRTDFLVAGDYDGDGKTDFGVQRNISGFKYNYVLTRTGSTLAQQWGISSDIPAPGDYDGDGTTDFAVWRGSSAAGQTSFYALNSGSGTVRAFQWGQCPTGPTCDLVTANWNVR